MIRYLDRRIRTVPAAVSVPATSGMTGPIDTSVITPAISKVIRMTARRNGCQCSSRRISSKALASRDPGSSLCTGGLFVDGCQVLALGALAEVD